MCGQKHAAAGMTVTNCVHSLVRIVMHGMETVQLSLLYVSHLQQPIYVNTKKQVKSPMTVYRYSAWNVYHVCDAMSLVSLGCVHTNRVESSPIQSSQTHKDAAGPLWLTMAAAAVRTHQQSRVESSHASLAESRVLMPHVLFS